MVAVFSVFLSFITHTFFSPSASILLGYNHLGIYKQPLRLCSDKNMYILVVLERTSLRVCLTTAMMYSDDVLSCLSSLSCPKIHCQVKFSQKKNVNRGRDRLQACIFGDSSGFAM